METFNFITVRLGKDSIPDIQKICLSETGVLENPFTINVKCTQVPDNYGVDDYAFLWLGSDNNKGMPTQWKQGFKAVGRVENVIKGKNYNDTSETTIKIVYIFHEAINRMDILRSAPVAYYWCSSMPLIGLDDHANQTIRNLSGSSFADLRAFFSAIEAVTNHFKKDILQIEPKFEQYFDFELPNPQSYPTAKNLDEISFIKRRSGAKTLQQIFYGAPGTGKSHEMNKLTKGCSIIRTTFHPDSDYSTFVGAYKPSMEDVDVRVVPVVVNKGIGLQDCGTYKEKRIVYKYVKQAFLKAYLAAWKKMCRQLATPITNPITLDNVFVITSIDDKLLWHSKTEKASKKRVGSTWQKLWNSGNFQIPKGRQSGETLEQAISNWIYSNYPNCTKNDFDKGWDLLIKEIKVKNEIETSTNKLGDKSKKFKLSPGENDDTVVYFTEGNKKDKKRIESCYNGTAKPIGVEKEIIKKLQDYHAPTFDDAWDELKKEFNNINLSTPESEDIAPNRQFLIIEEINRGNCAQIFGDIFQLLDRSDNGFSTYPIEADTDIQKAIADAFKSEPEYQLSCDINVGDAVKDYKSNYGKTLSEDIQAGRVLLLPPNLYIWATMNTSDQSLFPIDSAFKRRWEWKYLPINNHEDKNYKIEIGDTKYDWWGFLSKINEVIGDTTSSEDKKLGYFFAKANENGIVTAEQFVGKVLFYLWNDVFKNYGFDNQIFDKGDKKKFDFSDFFKQDGSPDTDMVNKFLGKLDETIDKENSFVEKPKDDKGQEEPSDTEA